jgi:glycosyltransferase involved in cell wall biosynthesis
MQKDMPKVLLLADPGSPYTIKWSKSLADSGFSILIFGLSDFDENVYLDYKNIAVYSMKFDEGIVKSNNSFLKISYLYCYFDLQRQIKKFRPDILHAHYGSSYGLLGALVNFHPFILSIWGSDVYDFPSRSFLYKVIMKFNFYIADVILSTSKTMVDEIRKYTTKKVYVIPFGVNTDLFKPAIESGTSDTTITIGYIKALEKIYGINYLLLAFRLLKDKYPQLPLKLLIMGMGSQENHLKKMAVELNLEPEFTGWIENDKLPNYLNQMAIVVIPSLDESFGVAALEASACGKPVVVTNVGGLTEIVQDEVTGLVIESERPDKLCEALEKLVLNEELRKELGTAGRKKIIKSYEWQLCLSEMIKVYHNVLYENIVPNEKVACDCRQIEISEKIKKILFIGDANSIHVKKWVDHFASCGYITHLATFSAKNITAAEHVYFLSQQEINVGGKNHHYLWCVPRLAALIAKIQPDHINAHYSYSMGFIALLALKWRRINVLLSVVCHGSDVLVPSIPFLSNFINFYVLNNADIVFSVSDQITKKLLAMGISGEKIYNGMYGVERSDIRNTSTDLWSTKEIDVVSYRSYIPNSRITEMLQALNRKEFYDKKIVFILPNADLKQLDELRQVYPFIIFYEAMPHEKLIELVAKSKIYISATKSDGTSLSLLEAMDNGAYPVVSNIPSNRVWVTDRVNGRIFNDFDQFAKILLESLTESKEFYWRNMDYNFKLIDDKALYDNRMREIEQVIKVKTNKGRK